jgi:hypothetical protein
VLILLERGLQSNAEGNVDEARDYFRRALALEAMSGGVRASLANA